MADSKRTKRVRDEGEHKSLEQHIQQRRQRLVDERNAVPTLRARACDFRRQAERMTLRWQVRTGKDLLKRAAELEAEAAVRESMSREHAFEQTVVSYLRMYHQSNEHTVALNNVSCKNDSVRVYMKHSDTTQHQKTAIVDEYLTEMNSAPAKVAMTTRDECPRCETKLLLCSERSTMSCPDCGYCVAYVDATSSHTAYDDVIEYSQYSYKRVNHYAMHLALVQGKETHRVPDEILQQVMADMYHRQRVRSVSEITPRRVRETLRRLRLRKAYDHVTQVTARLSGVRPPRIPPETEEKLKNLFLQMQPAFQRHAPKTRTNFLSYSYVLYRSFQILKLDNMLENISLLKGREKLEANDAIFRKMSIDLGWPLFDLPVDV